MESRDQPFSHDLDRAAHLLAASTEYRVMRRFHPRRQYAPDDDAPKRTGLFVDVETTGLDYATDAITEFAAVQFQYGVRDGRIYAVADPVTFLEDPGRPIPPEVSALTGITDTMVRGCRIDDTRLAELAANSSLVVAHNAAFDRPFVERRIPALRGRPWACSYLEVPWVAYGCGSAKLEFILFRHCREFFEGHRAADDCRAGVHVLATPLPDGTLPFAHLLASARTPSVRLWAHETHARVNDVLRARRYRWHAGDSARAKAWYRDLQPATVDAECAWLAATVYTGRRPAWRSELRTARTRYALRA